MRYFIHSLYPRRADIFLKTGDGVTVNKLWDVEKYPCLGSDEFRNRHHNVEIHARIYKDIYANMEALG
jgi:hypothetical protein